MSKSSMKERNKAIRKAWEKEKLLVQAGKGTRNWTKEQQSDILDPDKGKAYDEQGRAFEGQHMKSASEYPDYQGNPDNIQFLTKDEHLEAHKGSWQNPTNWFYDPITKEFYPFGEEELIPCTVLELSDPIVYIETNILTNHPENSDDLKQQVKKETKSPNAKSSPADENNIPPNNNGPTRDDAETDSKTEEISALEAECRRIKAKREEERIRNEVERIKYEIDHPFLSAFKNVVIDAASDAVPKLVDTAIDCMFSFYSDQDDSDTSDDSETDKKSISEETTNTQIPHQDHSSPSEHIVPGHGQHYHTKDGVIWKEKDPYKRGGEKGDTES